MDDPPVEAPGSTRYLGFAVAVVTIAAVELIRVFITLEYGLREDAGTLVAGAVAIIVFLAPFLAAVVRRALTPRGAIGTVITLTAVGLILVQLVRPIPIVLAAVVTALGLIGLTLLLHAYRARGPGRGADFAIAVMLGLAIDTALEGQLGTWGPMWRGSVGTLITIILAILVLAALPGMLADPAAGPSSEDSEPAFGSCVRMLAFGPFLMLELSFAQNAAFADATYGTSLPTGTAIVLAADAAAIALMISGVANRAGWFRVALGVIAVAVAWPITGFGGVPGVIALFLLGVALGPLVAVALSAGATLDRRAAWRTAVAIGLATTVFAVLSLALQVDITNPLPFSGRWITVAAPVIVLAATVAPPSEAGVRVPWRIVALPVALLVIFPITTAATDGSPALAQGNGTTLRILDWNIHSMVNADGMLDPESVVQVIEREHADVVTLQEATRGWLIAGATDEAAWMARRLGMEYAWSPAADSEFGNLLLSRFPIVSAEAVALPYVDGPQHRSFVVADIDIGGGTTVRVVGAHLESNTQLTHRTQVETMLEFVGQQEPTIIAGDMNMQPADPDAPLFEASGFHSAQDATGNSLLSSAVQPNFPGDRVDWIFGTKDVTFSDFSIPYSTASDHRPLAVTATVPRS